MRKCIDDYFRKVELAGSRMSWKQKFCRHGGWEVSL